MFMYQVVCLETGIIIYECYTEEEVHTYLNGLCLPTDVVIRHVKKAG